MDPRKPSPDRPDEPGQSPMPERIRNRRLRLGLSGTELARRIEVSPSYISLIESGAKVPSPSVATALARALDDDPELYVAWVQSARHGGWRRALRSTRFWQNYASNPSTLRRVASGEDLDDLPLDEASLGPHLQQTLEKRLEERLEESLEMRVQQSIDRSFEQRFSDERLQQRLVESLQDRVARLEAEQRRELARERREREEALAAGRADAERASLEAVGPATEPTREPMLLRVPVLEDGADPGDGSEVQSARRTHTLTLDRRLFAEAPRRPFAYRPSEEALSRVRGLLRPGDHVVLDSGVPPRWHAETIVAVRLGDRVVLGRALLKKNALLLLPAEDAADFDVVELPDRDALDRRVAGHVVLTVRTS